MLAALALIYAAGWWTYQDTHAAVGALLLASTISIFAVIGALDPI
jgi:hypothetical protein